MSAFTVLLVSDDPALLADECGGRVPTFVCDSKTRVWTPEEDCPSGYDALALLLVLDGVPVAMGCDRAARWSGRLMSDRLTPEEAMQIARWCRSQRGARVVLLRDGREVGS